MHCSLHPHSSFLRTQDQNQIIINPSEVGWGWQIKGRSEGYSLYNHLLVHLLLSHFSPWDPKVHLAGVGLFYLHSDCLQQSQVKKNKAPALTSSVKGTCLFVHIPVHTMTIYWLSPDGCIGYTTGSRTPTGSSAVCSSPVPFLYIVFSPKGCYQLACTSSWLLLSASFKHASAFVLFIYLCISESEKFIFVELQLYFQWLQSFSGTFLD